MRVSERVRPRTHDIHGFSNLVVVVVPDETVTVVVVVVVGVDD